MHTSSTLLFQTFAQGMFSLYRIVKRGVVETDLVQCEQEQVLHCVADIISFENGTK